MACLDFLVNMLRLLETVLLLVSGLFLYFIILPAYLNFILPARTF